MHDASEEIYEHILCSICPVNLSKAGLSYDVAENNIKDRIRDWVVSRPETGFLFPVFNDRSTDIHGTLYFNKNIKNIHPDFIENVLGTSIPRIPGNEINVFSDFIMDNFEGCTTFNFTESLVESLQEVREQKKDSPEMITVSCDEMEQILDIAEFQTRSYRISRKTGKCISAMSLSPLTISIIQKLQKF